MLKPLSNVKKPRDKNAKKTTFLTYAQLIDTTQNLVGLSADKLQQVVDTRLATASGSDRLTMLLGEVCDVQATLKEDLEKHLQRSNPLYFETYTQFTSAELVNELNKPRPGFYESDADVSAPDKDHSNVLDAAVNLNGALSDLFEDLAARADVDEIKGQLVALHDLVAGYNKRISGSIAAIGKIQNQLIVAKESSDIKPLVIVTGADGEIKLMRIILLVAGLLLTMRVLHLMLPSSWLRQSSF